MQHEDRHGGHGGDHDRPRPAVGRAGRWAGGGAARVLAAVVVTAFAWWAIALEPFSTHATLAVVLAGVAAMVVGGARRPRRSGPAEAEADAGAGAGPRSGATAGSARWLALCAAAGAWQLAAFVHHPRADHPTVSSLTNAALDSRLARTAALVLWLAAARALARR